MADNTNRTLRNRRPPQYLVGDNSDPELFGYARTNYIKDFTSPAQELNSFAKALTKFVNSANKRLLEKLNGNQPQQVSITKNRGPGMEEEVKKSQQNAQINKRKQNQKNESKQIPTKGNKDNGGLKQQQVDNVGVKDKIKTRDVSKKQLEISKNTKQPSKTDYYSNINYTNKMQQIKQQHVIGIGNMGKSQSDAAARAIQQQQQILNYNPALREKLQVQNNFQSNQSKTQQPNQKFFRRSSYHVAIAYHIHLNNIKQGGKQLQTPMNIDPTYYAKKLRGDFDHQ